MKGGKAYKKMKGGEKEVVEWIDIQRLQFVARVIRMLGDRNILCYCHDNVSRMCHIPRGMKGKSPDKLIQVGDIILISLRDFTANFLDPTKSTKEQLKEEKDELERAMKKVTRGDVIAKYPPDQVRSFKKDGLYPKLFMKLEEVTAIKDLENMGTELPEKTFTGLVVEDDLFDGETKEEGEEEEAKPTIVDKADKVNHRKEREVRDRNVIQQEENEITLDDL
jgi:translation initiation factor IF-1